MVFLMRGLITANLKVLVTYLNDNYELIIAKRGSMTSGSTSFSSLDGIGSNIQSVKDFVNILNSRLESIDLFVIIMQ